MNDNVMAYGLPPKVDLMKKPEWLKDEYDGEKVFGWKALTKQYDEFCQLGCLAPGSSPHKHGYIDEYLVVTESSVLYFTVNGLCMKVGMLHRIES